jgi:hypothetical protein
VKVCWAKVWTVARRLLREGRVADCRLRSGRVRVSKVMLMEVGDEVDRASARMATFLMW